MKRTTSVLTTDWLYAATDIRGAMRINADESRFHRVSVPHANRELPYHNFRDEDYAFVSWYRRWILIPAQHSSGRVLLQFDGVMIACRIYINGHQVGAEYKGGFTPITVDITDHVRFGEANLIAVRVDSTERKDIPPYGHVVDYICFGGIYRDVRILFTDSVYLENIFVRPVKESESVWRLAVSARIVNASEDEAEVGVSFSLEGDGFRYTHAKQPSIKAAPGTATTWEGFSEPLRAVKLWDLDSPVLYRATVGLSSGDALSVRVGFRTLSFEDGGRFVLNGRDVKLFGLNRHQTYPYIGAAAPARLQRLDAEVLKRELGCNVVRTSHYPQSPHFLDRCDELGLLVVTELPGWQHIGNEEWKRVSLRELEAMIIRDRNHPSLILWGVRINESKDDHDFYQRTNALAHRLDDTRQTGGVRNFRNSELLEDVYTCNDFAYDLRQPVAARYVVTEFGGHMYPTKSFDHEERVVQHALHHTHVQNSAANLAIAGAIGWCAFDYNTHGNFGSGDRICYHGVMDIFRLPKFAAYLYSSQISPERRVVLEVASYWKIGDRDGCGVDPLVVFSNVEEIEVMIGRKLHGRFKPSRDLYPHLRHAPFVLRGIGALWGEHWQDLQITGFIGGQKVATHKIANDGIPQHLDLHIDHRELLADGSDMTRISVRITDVHGNALPFSNKVVQFTVDGPAILIGENPMSPPGGRAAVFLRSTEQAGVVTVRCNCLGLRAQEVRLITRVVDPSYAALNVSAATRASAARRQSKFRTKNSKRIK